MPFGFKNLSFWILSPHPQHPQGVFSPYSHLSNKQVVTIYLQLGFDWKSDHRETGVVETVCPSQIATERWYTVLSARHAFPWNKNPGNRFKPF